MVTAQLPADQALAAARCSSCPKMCRGVCPTLDVTRNERHQPWGHAHEDVAAQRSAGAGGEGFAGATVSESAYMCATCAACTVPCEVEGVETPELVWAVRSAVWASGAAPAAAVEAVRQAEAGMVPTDDSPPRWVHPGSVMAQLAAMATPGAALLLVPGCGALGRRPAAVLAAGRALRALGVEFSVVPEHRCCGAVALAAGDGEGAEGAAAAVLGAGDGGADGGRVERIAVQSPSCAAHLARAGAHARPGASGRARASTVGSAGASARARSRAVVPLAAVLAEALSSRTGPTTATAAYHDPCMLARHLDATATPRAALRSAGIEVSELAARGPTTRCSGRGGLLSMTSPDVAAGYLELLAAEVRGAGVARLVTGCASCAAALEPALPGVDVAELAEAIAGALAGEAGGR